jgi:hypothetical protein
MNMKKTGSRHKPEYPVEAEHEGSEEDILEMGF